MSKFAWLPPCLLALLVFSEQPIAAFPSSDGSVNTIRAPSSAPRSLIPVTRRSSGLKSRSLSRGCMHPKNEVSTSYAEGNSESSRSSISYVSELRLKAHDGQPLVLLEEFEDLLSKVACDDSGIALHFHDGADAEFAMGSWGRMGGSFVAISSHASGGCNSAIDREPHLITDVTHERKTKTIRFSSKRVGWDAAYQSVYVSLDYFRPGQAHAHGKLVRRDTTTNITEGAAQSNDTISFKTSPGDRVELFTTTQSAGNTGLTGTGSVTCVGCGTDGQILVKGAVNIDSSLFKRDDENGLQRRFDIATLQTAFLEVEAVTDLTATAALELFAQGSFDKTFTKTVAKISQFTPFNVGGVITIGPVLQFDILAHLVSGAATLNLTYGAEAVVPKGSVATLDWANENNSIATGWENTKLTELPFIVNELDGDLSFAVNITAQPSITFGVEVVNGVFGSATAGFQAGLPEIFANATLVKNVTSDCNEGSINIDIPVLGEAVQITGGLALSLDLTAGTDEGAELLPSFMQTNFTIPLLRKEFPFGSRCMTFDPQKLGALVMANGTNSTNVYDSSTTAASPNGTQTLVSNGTVISYSSTLLPNSTLPSSNGSVPVFNSTNITVTQPYIPVSTGGGAPAGRWSGLVGGVSVLSVLVFGGVLV